ncbi:hypothetical protein BU23DRAFT_584972 [Bimuria novae-zelandiae CBS 107.79]|uniref:PRISE-like Rossmann-fold domain-containing protein n=1 Tax=Bimuria novae-zelandiae CBS 107.79 TaxID=1447943 RepID=A0A6A5UJX3_9PLEO|nr:hypothetical protein BU23DRAFT_584972 [Bimuria novae-zelandiae CBS 107.79]
MGGSHALVIGASGVIGWAVVDQLLRGYPTPGTFAQVSALVNRPLSLEDAFWPRSEGESGVELELTSGPDLLGTEAEIERVLREKVGGVESVREVFYFEVRNDHIEEVKVNVGMLRRLVRSIARLSPTFRAEGFLVYPGGTRGYGIYRPDGVFTAPLREEMAECLPEDYARTVAYPHYRAILTAESTHQGWSWCELCPDVVVGFTPNGSGFSLGGHWAVYLYAYALVHGKGAEVPFPGTLAGYDAQYTETSTAVLARVGIHAALHASTFRERIFNVADSGVPGRMRERWPEIAAWFGLRGVTPREGASAEDVKPSEFVKAREELLREKGAKGVQIWNAGQLDSYGYWLTFDRQLSLERLREAGFEEERPPREGWEEAFEMFRRAGMIGK